MLALGVGGEVLGDPDPAGFDDDAVAVVGEGGLGHVLIVQAAVDDDRGVGRAVGGGFIYDDLRGV